MLNISILIIISFMMATITLSLQFTHFLMSLFCLEAMMLTSMLIITITSCTTNMNMPYLAMVLLTLGACEASIGLSLMVSMSRNKGSDMLNSLSTNKC